LCEWREKVADTNVRARCMKSLLRARYGERRRIVAFVRAYGCKYGPIEELIERIASLGASDLRSATGRGITRGDFVTLSKRSVARGEQMMVSNRRFATVTGDEFHDQSDVLDVRSSRQSYVRPTVAVWTWSCATSR
jgi:hypothetical protein